MRLYKSIRTKITKKVCRELNISHKYCPYVTKYIWARFSFHLNKLGQFYAFFNFFKNYHVFLYLTDRIET